MSAKIIAFGAISALGRGRDAISAGNIGEVAANATRVDDELAASKLARPFCARVQVDATDDDRAASVLRAAWNDLTASLDAIDSAWRSKRVGLALASSSGGMRSAEELFRALHNGVAVPRALGERATYYAPMHRVITDRFSPATLVLTACSASTIAIGIGLGWLEQNACDLVIAGGFDAVSVFVASGFEALRATTAQIPSRPFGVGRDGMCLGEGAALLALTRADEDETQNAIGYVTGFGASGDAIHVTAPDRTGAGLARAAKAALGNFSNDIDVVSAHGTATPFNDAAEWKAMVAALGEDGARHAIVHPFKAQIGHTLGAAGALESLAALDALARHVLPASVVAPERDPETPARLIERTESGSPRAALKLSAAFGGANASLTLRMSETPTSRKARARRVYATRWYQVTGVPKLVDLAEITGIAAERLARADDLVFVAMGAIGGLKRAGLSLAGAGIVVGHAYATVDVNDRYFERVIEKNDARAAEARRFPYTSPNAVAGECSLAFGLTGPNLAVSSGLHGGVEAFAIAADLVRAGDADQIVAVAVDAPRRAAIAIAESCGWPITRDGAVAILVARDPIDASSREILSTETATRGAPKDIPNTPGHQALLPLFQNARVVASASPWGSYARVTLT